MSSRAREHMGILGMALVAAFVFYCGIGWGLPSRAADPFLFGNRTPWTGRQIQALCGNGADNPLRGADVPTHALDRSQTLLLNGDDRQRAEIVRRYRLFTYQPDEMLTLMSLSRMKPSRGDLDPRMYQYGGLFIYPVGAALKVASILHLIDLRADPTYYLDHPAAFGRFYVVARGLVAAWGVLGVWIVWSLARRLGCSKLVSAAAALAYATMPVVINMAHEAKPHLQGAVLMLATVLAAHEYVRSGRTRWAMLTGIAAGAALGSVVSALLVFSVIPAMVFLRADPMTRRIKMIVGASAVAAAVYVITNPYVPINAITNRAVLKSNLGNSTGMYHVGHWGSGVVNAISLIGEGASPLVAILGTLSVLWHSRPRLWSTGGRHGRKMSACGRTTTRLSSAKSAEGGCATSEPRDSARLAILLAIPAALQLIQFIALAAGKPGEYGRFALFLDIALMLACMAGISRAVRNARWAAAGAIAVAIGTGIFGSFYLAGFLRDRRPVTSRLAAAAVIRSHIESGARSVAVWAEPAPYSMPPVDLFRCRLLLLRANARVSLSDAPADILIPPVDAVQFPVEIPAATRAAATIPAPALHSPRISWADRRFCVLSAEHVGR